MKFIFNPLKQINNGNRSHKDTSPKSNQRKKLLTMAPNPEIETNYDYVYQLKSMIADERITNIALEGDYGSGKSSIIQKLMTEKNFLKEYKPKIISFITFDPGEMAKRKITSVKKTDDGQRDNDQYSGKAKETNDNKKQEGDRIEKDEKDSTQNANINSFQISELIQSEIVKQLFYGEKPNATKWSNYGRIGRTYYWASATMTALVLPLLLQPLLSFSEVCSKYVPLEIVDKLPSSFAVAITCMTLFVIWLTTTFITNKLISNILNGSIKNISAKDFSVEINDHKPDFEQMVDLLINYFSQTEHKVIIFEDLDRFNNSLIFEEIKQLNTVVNNSEIVEEKITFVYAIRGSIINTPGDRTKLFDAIIPIIPFYSKSNVEAIFQEMIKDTGINNDITPAIIGSVSEYINDIRVLYSIANNLTIYSSVFDMDNELTIKSCTSLAIIKTLYPDEYNSLATNKNNSKIESALKSIREKRQAVKESIDGKYNIDNILERNKKLIFAKLFTYLENYRPAATSDLPSEVIIDSIKYSTRNLNMNVLYNASRLEIYWPSYGIHVYNKNEIDACLSEIKEINDYKSGKYLANMQKEYTDLFTAKNKDLYNESFLSDKEKFPAINALFTKGHILDGISFYVAKTNYSKTELQIQKFIHEQIRSERIDKTLDVSNYVKKLVDRIYPEDFRSIGVYNYNIFDYLTNEQIDAKEAHEKFQTIVDNIKNNEKAFRSFAYDYAIRDMSKMRDLSITRATPINEELTKLSSKSGFIRLINKIVKIYPAITIWLSAEIYANNKSVATLILNKTLIFTDNASIAIDGAHKAILSLFAPYIIESNTEKYIKLLAANQVPLFDITELVIADKNKTMEIIDESNAIVYISRSNIDYVGEEYVKKHLIKTSRSDCEILEAANYNRNLLVFIINNPSIFVDSKLEEKTIAAIYNKAIKQKVDISEESAVYGAKYLSQSSLIGLILSSPKDKNTITNILSATKDGQLKKIINGGYIELKNTRANVKFAKVLKELEMAKNYWLKNNDTVLVIHVPKNKLQS